MPFGKNSHLTVLRHFPRWHQLAFTSLTESAQVFALFCCSYLLPGWLINALCLLPQLSVINAASSSPIHPEKANGPEGRKPAPGTAAASPLTRIKYGAEWKKRRTPGEGFPWVSSGAAPLKRFVQVLNGQVFALMQKTDCLSRKAASLTFSVLLLAKFCAC